MKKLLVLLFSITLFISCDDPIDLPLQVGNADLEISMLVDNDSPEFGETIRFTITIKNNGYDDATNVAVNTRLPSGFAFTGSDMTSGLLINPDVWTINRVYRNSTEVLLIDALVVDNMGDYEFIVEVASASPMDPDSTPNNLDSLEDDIASITIMPVRPADLSLVIAGDDLAPIAGQDITVTYVVTNDGPNDALGVSVTNPIPSGYTYVSDTAAGFYNPTTGKWFVGDIANDDDASFQVVLTVLPAGDYIIGAEIENAFPFDLDSTPNNGIETEDDQYALTVVPRMNVVDDTETTTMDTAITITVTANDTHLPATGTTTLTTPTSNGTVVLNDGGTPDNPNDDTFTYTPNPGFVGLDSFVYTICDDGTPATCEAGIVTITVN